MIDEAAFFHFTVLVGRFCRLLVYIGAIGDAPPAVEVKKTRTMVLSLPFHCKSLPPSIPQPLFWHLSFFFFLLLSVSWCFTLHFMDCRLRRGKKTEWVRRVCGEFLKSLLAPTVFWCSWFLFFFCVSDVTHCDAFMQHVMSFTSAVSLFFDSVSLSSEGSLEKVRKR